MKNFQQNLLIILAIALCGLCAFQWREQTLQRQEIQTMNGILYNRNIVIRDATNSIATQAHQIEVMDTRLTEAKAEAATNEQLAVSQKADITRLEFANENLTNEVAQYKAAVDTLEGKLKEAYAGIEKQNESITNLVSQRDELAKKFNDEVKDRNDVVKRYNDLVKKVEATEKQ